MNSADIEPARSRPGFKGWIIGLSLVGLLTLLAISGGAVLAYSILQSRLQSSPTLLSTFAAEPVIDQIAFTGNDNNLYLVSPTGDNLRPLTRDRGNYRFPTWSPDGSHLAFIGRAPGGNSNVLYISPTSQSNPQIVYQEDSSSPFYLYWAPNSRALTFLTQEGAELSMRLVDLALPDNNRVLETGSPFYWVWSPGGDRLLMHVGGSRLLSETAHISLLDSRRDAERVELGTPPGRFQAPAWSSDGRHIYYVSENEGREGIFQVDINTFEQQTITNLAGYALLVLSPDGEHVAYLQMEAGTRPPFGRAYVVGTDGRNRKRLMNNLVASIYWSPDGQKLALLSFTRPNEGPSAKVDGLARPVEQDFQLRWWIYDLETDSLEPLVSFSPTTAFLQTLPYFDQYYLSLSFWDPDSRYFVITRREDETGNGSVWVYDTTGAETARQIGEGRLAVWSWK